MSEIDKFHELAKDAGNKLRTYILSVSSGGTGVFFLALTKPNSEKLTFTVLEKWLLVVALISFVLTVIISLYELRIDAKRFFNLAKELEKVKEQQNWNINERFKRKRYWLIHSTYFTLGIGLISTGIYLMLKIFSI